MISFGFYQLTFLILMLLFATNRPQIDEILFWPWLALVILSNILWWTLRPSIMNVMVWLLLSPLCIFLSLFFKNPVSNDPVLEFKIITGIFVIVWCIVGLYGNKELFKPAILFIDAILKSVLLYYGNKYLLEHISTINISIQESACINLLVLPLTMAVVWGKLFLDLREEIMRTLPKIPMIIYTSIFSKEFRYFIKLLSDGFKK